MPKSSTKILLVNSLWKRFYLDKIPSQKVDAKIFHQNFACEFTLEKILLEPNSLSKSWCHFSISLYHNAGAIHDEAMKMKEYCHVWRKRLSISSRKKLPRAGTRPQPRQSRPSRRHATSASTDQHLAQARNPQSPLKFQTKFLQSILCISLSNHI